jgi:hypothetical protein
MYFTLCQFFASINLTTIKNNLVISEFTSHTNAKLGTTISFGYWIAQYKTTAYITLVGLCFINCNSEKSRTKICRKRIDWPPCLLDPKDGGIFGLVWFHEVKSFHYDSVNNFSRFRLLSCLALFSVWLTLLDSQSLIIHKSKIFYYLLNLPSQRKDILLRKTLKGQVWVV